MPTVTTCVLAGPTLTREAEVRAVPARGQSRFEKRAQFSTWLYRIAFNEAQRRISRRPPPRG